MRSSLCGVSVLLVAALAMGCGSGDQNGTNSGGTGGTGGSNTGGAGGASNGGSDSGGNSTGGGNTGGASTGGSSTGGGQPCGGLAGGTCAADHFCDFAGNMCDAVDEEGKCAAKPMACDANLDPVCGCNGTVYGNACEAQMAGQDIQLLGGCPAPEGQFACGAGFCEKGSEYCQIQISDVGGEPNSYSCAALPVNCQSAGATCACLSDVSCGNNCELSDGAFTLTCPGG